MSLLTILSVPVWALKVDLAWSLSLDSEYKGSEKKTQAKSTCLPFMVDQFII